MLQKIAEVEKLEIEDADIDAEIDEIADRSGESPRKVRARMEKEDLIEALATELLERKALDLVLKEATYDDYEMNPGDERRRRRRAPKRRPWSTTRRRPRRTKPKKPKRRIEQRDDHRAQSTEESQRRTTWVAAGSSLGLAQVGFLCDSSVLVSLW